MNFNKDELIASVLKELPGVHRENIEEFTIEETLSWLTIRFKVPFSPNGYRSGSFMVLSFNYAKTKANLK